MKDQTTRQEQDNRINACCDEFMALIRTMYEDGRADADTILHSLAVIVGASLHNVYGSRDAALLSAKSFADEVAEVIDLESMEKQTGGRLQ